MGIDGELVKLLVAAIFGILTILGVPAYGKYKESKGIKKGKEQAESKQRVSVAEATTEIIKEDRKIEKESDGMSTAELLDSLYDNDAPADSE